MNDLRDGRYFEDLVRQLLTEPAEAAWLEFKHGNDNPEQIAKYISALSNGAALVGRQYGYLLWGIDDSSREPVGTKVAPETARKGGAALPFWLSTATGGDVVIDFGEGTIDGKRVVCMRVEASVANPTKFKGVAYIRTRDATPRLADHPGIERQLWTALQGKSYEKSFSVSGLSQAEALALLDIDGYYRLHRRRRPQRRADVVEELLSRDVFLRAEDGSLAVSNLGGALYAKTLDTFPNLRRKRLRVSQYLGLTRADAKREFVLETGYAVGFEEAIERIHEAAGTHEVIGRAFRETHTAYPDIVIRELLANQLIHQDFTVRGAGPIVSVFGDRIEFTNPGEPLIETKRFLDSPPRSRNELVATRMREMKICEEEGTGIDKVVIALEHGLYPAPSFTAKPESTVAAVYAPVPFDDMDAETRIWGAYYHACLLYVQNSYMTNASLRKRFGVDNAKSPYVSRVIRDAIGRGLLRPYDPTVGNRAMKYVPFWA